MKNLDELFEEWVLDEVHKDLTFSEFVEEYQAFEARQAYYLEQQKLWPMLQNAQQSVLAAQYQNMMAQQMQGAPSYYGGILGGLFGGRLI